jgi:SAM-dependent methyltransferase
MAPDKWANPKAMWDERFSQTEPVYGEGPNRYLRSQVHRLAPAAKVLVPADGYGRNGIWLAKHGFRVHTVDLSPVGVERARKSAEAAGVSIEIEAADLGAWNWPLSEFDAVVCIFFHLPSTVRGRIHRSMLNALQPGGIVILEAFTPAQLQFPSGGPKQVDLLYSADLLRDDFAGAEILLLEEKVAELEEGALHSGPGAVVQAILRRK